MLVILIGLTITGFGGFGVYNALNPTDEVREKAIDVTTEGVVRDITVTKVKHQIGITLTKTFRVHYAFQADDGEFYQGEEIIEEDEIGDLATGKPIKIMYHSTNPSINAAPNYGHYVSVDDMPDFSPEDRLKGCLGIIAFGLLVTLGGMFVVKSGDDSEKSE